jgi:hypothetical protein
MVGSGSWIAPADTTGVAISWRPVHKAYKSPAPMATIAKTMTKASLFPAFAILLTSLFVSFNPAGSI